MSTRQEDYLALDANKNSIKHGLGDVKVDDLKVVSGVQSAIIKDLLIPEIEKEVNEGQTFANLRQIYNAVILASWYKQALKESLLGQIYVDQKKIKGVETDDKTVNEQIYNQYVESFKKGVYNYIKEDYNPETQEVENRKYFSGGAALNRTTATTEIKKDAVVLSEQNKDLEQVTADLASAADTGATMTAGFNRREFLRRSILTTLAVGAGFVKPPFLNDQSAEGNPLPTSSLRLSLDHLENLSKNEALSYMRKLDELLKEGKIPRAEAEKFLWKIHQKSLFVWMRAEAIKMLIRHKFVSFAQVPELLDSTPDVEVIKAIYQALAEHPDEKIVRFLRERIQVESRDNNLQIYVWVLFENALEKLDTIPQDIAKEIMDASREADFFVYKNIFDTTKFTPRALAYLAGKDKEANERLISLSKIKDKADPQMLGQAQTPEAEQRLLEWSLDQGENKYIRSSIARTLGNFETAAVKKRLLEWSGREEDRDIKESIIKSLKALGTKDAIDRIVEMSNSLENEQLGQLGYFLGKLKDSRIETLLIQWSYHKDPEVRKRMVYGLADLKTEPAIQRLLDWSKDFNEDEEILEIIVENGLQPLENDEADRRMRDMYQEAKKRGNNQLRSKILSELSNSGTRDKLQWFLSQLASETDEEAKSEIVQRIFEMAGYKAFDLFEKGKKDNDAIQTLINGIDDVLREMNNQIIGDNPQLGESLLTQFAQRLKNQPEVLYLVLSLSQEVTSHSFPKFYGVLNDSLKRTSRDTDILHSIKDKFGSYFMTEFLFTLTIFGELENVFSKTQYGPEALADLIFSTDNMAKFIDKPALFTKIVVNMLEFKNVDLRAAFINQIIELSNSHKEFKLLLKLITEYSYLKTIDPRIAGLIADVKLPTLNPVWKQPQQNWIDSADGSLRVGLYWAADNAGEKAHYEQFAEIFKNGKKVNDFYSAFEGYEDRSADSVYKAKMQKYGANKILVKKFSDTGRTVEIYMYSDLEKIKESTHPIIISRGHAGHVPPNYPGIIGGMRLASQCRSINLVDSLIKINHDNVPIGIHGTGQATETNPILYYTLEYLGSQKTWGDWKNIKDFIRPHIPQSVNKYNFPSDDVSLIFAATLQAIGSEVKGDNALLSSSPGGIDLNPTILSTEIKRNGRGVIIPTFRGVAPDLKGIDGFVPNIIKVTPVSNLQLLLGLETESNMKPQKEKSTEISYNLSLLPNKK